MKSTLIPIYLVLCLTLLGCGIHRSERQASSTPQQEIEEPALVDETPAEEEPSAEVPAEIPIELPASEPSDSFSLVGTFRSEHCFLNKMASEGFGQRIYSKATIRFLKNGSGLNAFELYEDENCEKEILSGLASFTYELVKTFGNVSVLKIEQQNDPENEKDVSVYWLTLALHKNGLFLDIDYSTGSSGPYVSEPDEKEVSEFSNDVEKKGVLFTTYTEELEQEEKAEKSEQLEEFESAEMEMRR